VHVGVKAFTNVILRAAPLSGVSKDGPRAPVPLILRDAAKKPLLRISLLERRISPIHKDIPIARHDDYDSAGRTSGSGSPLGPHRVKMTLAADSTPSTTMEAAAKAK